MTLKHTADANVGLALLAGFFMFIGGFLSLVLFMNFLDDGEIVAEIFVAPCIVLIMLSIGVLVAFNFSIVRVLVNAEVPAGRRAAYFQLLFPLVLISFLIATPEASFAPSITFAFPLLLIGAVGYPYTALEMKKWVKAAEHENLVVLRCFRCSYQLEMHRDEKWLRCPYCGQVNMNPGKPGDGEDKKDAREEPLTP